MRRKDRTETKKYETKIPCRRTPGHYMFQSVLGSSLWASQSRRKWAPSGTPASVRDQSSLLSPIFTVSTFLVPDRRLPTPTPNLDRPPPL